MWGAALLPYAVRDRITICSLPQRFYTLYGMSLSVELIPGYAMDEVKSYMKGASSFCGGLPPATYLTILAKADGVRDNVNKSTLFLLEDGEVRAFALVRLRPFPKSTGLRGDMTMPALYVDIVCSRREEGRKGKGWAIMKTVELVAAWYGVEYVVLTSLYKPYTYYRNILGYTRKVSWFRRSRVDFLTKSAGMEFQNVNNMNAIAQNIGKLYNDERQEDYDLSDGVHLFKFTDPVECTTREKAAKMIKLSSFLNTRQSISMRPSKAEHGVYSVQSNNVVLGEVNSVSRPIEARPSVSTPCLERSR